LPRRATLCRLASLLVLAGLALVVAAAPAQATVLGPRAGHSPNADDIRTAYWVVLAIAALAAIALHAALIVAVVRFRARRGRVPRRVAARPGAFLRPAAPLAVAAAFLFVFGIVMAGKARNVEPSGPEGLRASAGLVAQVGGVSVPSDAKPLDINAIGQWWLWRFEYPVQERGRPVFSYGQLVVPVDTAVVLHVTSTDVTHRWFIPALGGQVEAVPGKTSDSWFRADREGVYRGQSTMYSGSGFSAMRAWVRVVSPQEYQRFVRDKKRQLLDAQNYVQGKVQANEVPGLTAP